MGGRGRGHFPLGCWAVPQDVVLKRGGGSEDVQLCELLGALKEDRLVGVWCD